MAQHGRPVQPGGRAYGGYSRYGREGAGTAAADHCPARVRAIWMKAKCPATARNAQQHGGTYATPHGSRAIGSTARRRLSRRWTEELQALRRTLDRRHQRAPDRRRRPGCQQHRVRVTNGKVTLEGKVDQRWMKHRAEDIVDACTGVKEIDNRIQVTSLSSVLGQRTADTRETGSSRATGTQTTATPDRRHDTALTQSRLACGDSARGTQLWLGCRKAPLSRVRERERGREGDID